MIPTNIKLTDDLVLDPSFALFLEPLALANPNWEFTPQTANYNDTRTTAHVQRDEDNQYLSAPAGTKFLNNVKVKQDGQRLGFLKMDGKHTAEGHVPNYIIKSWRIHKSRGTYDETETTKLKIALRNAKKFLKPRTLIELFTKKSNELQSGFADATASLVQSFRYIGQDFSGDVQLYAYCILTNRDVPQKTKANVEKVMTASTYERQIGDYQLALDMKELESAGRLMSIVKTRDDKYMYASKNADPIVVEYEELPVPWQEKLAVLQLLQNDELAGDIGYRHTSHTFMIVT